MTGAHIQEGDVVVLEYREPRDGDVVAALIDGETTLKRFVLKEGQPYLKAENPAYPDLLPATELIVKAWWSPNEKGVQVIGLEEVTACSAVEGIGSCQERSASEIVDATGNHRPFYPVIGNSESECYFDRWRKRGSLRSNGGSDG